MRFNKRWLFKEPRNLTILERLPHYLLTVEQNFVFQNLRFRQIPDSRNIWFTQSNISYNIKIARINIDKKTRTISQDSYRPSWAVDVVTFDNLNMGSIDNRRVFCAKNANSDIVSLVHGKNQPPPSNLQTSLRI